jgi:broad specificity phosphatase PhoE
MESRTIISTLRHAHTDYNHEKRYAGSLDIGLSEKGIRDAAAASAKLAAMNFDAVVTSPLRRAFETARLVMPDSVPIAKSRLCVERHFGILEGLTWDDVPKLDPPVLLICVGGDLHTVNPKGGEPFEDVWQRAKKFRRCLLNRYGGRNVLVVSHGVFLQMFHGVMRGLNCIESLADYPLNMELTRFEFEGERLIDEKIIKLADTDGKQW